MTTTPIVINNINDLQAVQNNLSANYVLGANIDAAGFSFTPIGSAANPFTGIFDGQGHTISNLTIHNVSNTDAGLFGDIGTTGTVSNVGLINESVTSSYSNVGGLVGTNFGTVSQSYVTGNVSGATLVGALVGFNGASGSIARAYATGTANGQIAGGLVGVNDGAISDSYATGSVNYFRVSLEAGGLVGLNGGSITQSYATGLVGLSGGFVFGGLVAVEVAGPVTVSYWDTETTGRSISGGGTGLTTAELQSGVLPAGFDPTIWFDIAGRFPELRWQAPPINVNHAPVAATIAAGANEDTNILPVMLTALFTDADLSDTFTFSTDTTGTAGLVTNNHDGTFTYDPNGKFEYLSLGETATDSFTYTVTDNHGASSTATATVTIHGENDAPLIESGSSVVAASLNEVNNLTGSILAADSTVGAVAFTDLDLTDRPNAGVLNQTLVYHDANGHDLTSGLSATQVAAFEGAFKITAQPGNTNTGEVDWGYTINDRTLDFLSVGESITVKSTIEIDDGHGGKVDRDVVVKLNGADDAPTAIPHFLTVQRSSTLSADAAHGALAGASDPDTHDTLTVFAVNGLPSNVGQRIAGAYGSLALNTDGSLAYTPNKIISFSGSQVTDHFSYSVTDSHGDVVTSALDIAVLKNSNSVPINSSQGLVITPHWDTSIFSLSPAQQAQYENAVDAAINILETTFSNPVKLDINFGWGEEGGNTISGNDVAAQSLSNRTPILTDYSTIYAKLVSDPLYDKTAFKSLPFPTSTDGKFYESKTFYVTNAEAKALGLTPLAESDGDVGLNSFSQLAGFDTFTFDPNQRSTPNKIDAIGVLIHEITEVMGRVSAIGQTGVGLEADWHGWYTPLDLFRYSTAGVHALTSGSGSFSEGKRLLLPFNNPELVKGDAGDWARGISGDSFGGWNYDKKLEFSPTDHLVMSALDWHLV